MGNGRLLIVAVVATLSASSGAAQAADSASRIDPAEKVNRASFAIFEFFDRHLIRPAAIAYTKIFPAPLRDGVRHMLDNLGEPRTAANDIIQGRFKMAGTATLRFATNSTFGLFGFFDLATPGGLPRHVNGFELTLGRWGVKSGPYLFIPFLGPTTVRDGIGGAVNTFFDPLNGPLFRQAPTFLLAKGVVDGLDTRARADSELTAVLGDATDPYATLRSLYLQSQQSKIDDTATTVPALPDFDDGAASAPTTPTPAPSAAPVSTTPPVLSAPPVPSATPTPSAPAEPAPAPAPASTDPTPPAPAAN